MVIVKNLYLDEEATLPTDCLCLLCGFAYHHLGDDDDEVVIFGEDDDDDEGYIFDGQCTYVNFIMIPRLI
jgi:hypothetical protein